MRNLDRPDAAALALAYEVAAHAGEYVVTELFRILVRPDGAFTIVDAPKGYERSLPKTIVPRGAGAYVWLRLAEVVLRGSRGSQPTTGSGGY